ncbi:MAG: hypothetical protein U0031_22045 [Thermomicrobiales bacterium]
MPVSWRPSTPEEHEALPKKATTAKDPEWEAIMQELERGNTVIIEYHDQKERGSLARAIGRRAANHGFRVDIRKGSDYLSVRMIESNGAEAPKQRKARAAKSAS